MLETDLYPPIRDFLAGMGYDVRSEVNGCDLVARRGDEIVVVELKTSINVTLLLQGIDRQRMTDSVYLGIPAPRNPMQRRWLETVRLCRMLGLGIITVRFRGRREPWVEVACEPGPYRPRKQPQRRARLLKEFSERSGDFNVGGSTRRPLVTAYREESLHIARFIQSEGEAAVRAVRESTGIERAGEILQRNYYDWFRRVRRGTYALTPTGEAALATYVDVVKGRP